LIGGIISLTAALTPIEKISEMCSMGTLLAFSMVCLAVLILRIKEPALDRPYKTPAIWFVAPAGVLFNIFLMTQVRIQTWYTFIIWGVLGVLVYFLYSRRHSNLEPKK
jgi:APA family basic amino acid/polyamine antiporter